MIRVAARQPVDEERLEVSCVPPAAEPTTAQSAEGRVGRFGSRGRELSAIRNVARSTVTTTPQRGHFGVMVLPVTPSK
jgi:hypothetical protein